MREEVKENELDQVVGGKYAINNKNVLFFQTISGSWPLKVSRYTAMEAMDGLIGKYETEAEYDQACLQMMQENGWV